MTSPICYKDRQVQMNNSHFANFMDLSLAVAERLNPKDAERASLEKIREMRADGVFCPGRGMVLEDDFDSLEELQFWARVSFETAQSIFLREVGSHANAAWQAQMIYFAYAIGKLFLDAFRDVGGDPSWYPETRASEEFRRMITAESGRV